MVSSSAIARASGKERASRSSLVTTSVSLAARRESFTKSRTLTIGAGQAVVDVDVVGLDAKGEWSMRVPDK